MLHVVDACVCTVLLKNVFLSAKKTGSPLEKRTRTAELQTVVWSRIKISLPSARTMYDQLISCAMHVGTN